MKMNNKLVHPVDYLTAVNIDQQVKDRHVDYDRRDKSDEAKQKWRHMHKLARIIRIEHRLCGQEDW
jgi:hypothetical protein